MYIAFKKISALFNILTNFSRGAEKACALLLDIQCAALHNIRKCY